MARSRSPNRDKAFEIFKKHKGKIKNKDIAKMLDEDPKTVSKWKTLDKWEENFKNSKKNNKNSNFEKDDFLGDEKAENIEVENQLNEIVENIELTEKQILFCIYYIKCFNASKAYQKAYKCNMMTAYTAGPRLLGNVHVKMAIAQLKQNRLNQAMLTPHDIFQKYMDIAFADITDYITFGKKDTLLGFTKEGVPIYDQCNYIDFKESDDIDGSLITEFKEGKNGFSIKLMDRLKALNWLSDHMDMATEEQKAKVESLRNKVRVENETLELKKKQAEKDDW
ncbi:terminase small subunit [Mobilitalea sibirica]|uniref:Terminase small subunit n=1 Tax=Mobilitalea sibirica TaxID=1462919 RepID=A0A8J7KTQ7_9FIRM|nr:terminase small subunit [Mobilitalea sibirica]MBH1941646.1 terminase small subunit [Mobilitalea sibirica]